MTARVRDIMHKDVETVRPETRLPELGRAFQHSRVSGFPVVEKDGRLVGIVSRSDVIRQLAIEQSLGEAMVDSVRDDTDEDWAESSAQEIGQLVGRRMEGHRVGDIMRTDLISAAPDDSLGEVAARMLERGVHRVPVVEDGQLVGLISSMDFVRLAADS